MCVSRIIQVNTALKNGILGDTEVTANGRHGVEWPLLST